ncbi:hypothetical protein [Amycolatopsis sp. FDAARGOS 1241]|uniref:hypothetical protein n=1 Tax=Amycolatopsis sp. FDAARGOS 1241 TaxID=2778070 RepID=UPI0019521A40|nr:hypothetical protein [Amycolatopsis sp. FDAARGOS 1241]QRP44973.1 hypothetical protein I6J71_38190 [Amycolatopsis sp. FDAARGOS 1241]
MTDAEALGVTAARLLAALDCCPIEPGLTDAEFARVEAEHGISFTDDHRAFLAAGLPVDPPGSDRARWPDWRAGPRDDVHHLITFETDLLTNAIRTGHWEDAWGPRPPSGDSAVAVFETFLAGAEQIVPIYAHRYVPGRPGSSGNPVLSMYGFDIIYYGADLPSYIANEFGGGDLTFPDGWEPAPLAFWDRYL